MKSVTQWNKHPPIYRCDGCGCREIREKQEKCHKCDEKLNWKNIKIL